MTLHQAGALPAAESAYRAVLQAAPRHAATLNLLATVVAQGGRPAEAVPLFDASLKLDRNQELAWFNRGNALFELKRHAEALASYNRAVPLWPGHAPLLNNRGNALLALGRKLEALASFDKAIAINPGYADAHFNRGNALSELDRGTEALASLDRAAALDPEHAMAQFNRATLRLRLGQYAEGWRLYEWRWQVPEAALRRPFPPDRLWLGEQDISGQTVLLYAEQGFGDSIQCCRYAPMVAERGARVILEVQPALLPAVARLDGVAECVAAGDRLPPFDWHCPLMSLPLAFRTELGTVPRQVPYLRAAPDSVRRWAERLGPRRLPRVGLVWAGSRQNLIDDYRSVSLAAVLPLRACGAELIAVQKEASPQDRKLMAGVPGLRFLGDELNDFGDTAAVLELLDLVVTVDTSVAHLAGALGRPVWVMLSPAADWRWLAGDADAPWYPTARLFRWDKARGWAGVVANVSTALAAFCRDGGSSATPRTGGAAQG